MTFFQRLIFVFVLIFLLNGLLQCQQKEDHVLEWPEITNETKPWTRWWWHGSAVNTADLTRLLEEYATAGFGGVEITPIYGVHGYEDQFIDYLSPRWMDMLAHTLTEAERLQLGVDMATGTGWPFGGPWIGPEHAPKRLVHQIYQLQSGEQLTEPVTMMQDPLVRAVRHRVSLDTLEYPVSENDHLQTMALEQVRYNRPLPLLTLMAFSEQDSVIDLTHQVDANGRLNWTAPAGNWTLYAVFQGWHGKMVERAAPGGEGNVMDHFSREALAQYLTRFDSALAETDISPLRSFFNDSYEVDDAAGEADWTPDFFEAFQQRRGYDLRNHLPTLFADQNTEQHRRVLSDYRQTVSDLMLERFTVPWQEWAHQQDAQTRNQAHGSPANILDLYAASDIPETEGTDVLRAKFATSAAHVTGKSLVSAEASTWLGEHFTSTLADVKRNLDRYFTAGVNHVVYHGSAYSPAEADWPGWLFYAAVHFNERNSWWDHLKTLNSYVTRVQSFLQSGRPDHDILLYFPVFDRFATSGSGLLEHFDGEHPRESDATFGRATRMLDSLGYTFDYISDRQLQGVKFRDQQLVTSGGAYRTILIPRCKFIPLETVSHLLQLARNGATILFFEGLPENVPGVHDLADRQQKFREVLAQFDLQKQNDSVVQKSSTGGGSVMLSDNLQDLLSAADIRRERLKDLGLTFHRRTVKGETVYFITNWSNESVRSWVPLTRLTESAVLYNPQNGKNGFAETRENDSAIYLSLQRGESILVKTIPARSAGELYPNIVPSENGTVINGPWRVEFLHGGPEIPDSSNMDSLRSWHTSENAAQRYFSGVARYSTEFALPVRDTDWYLLDLGTVHQSATVRLNGDSLTTLLGPEFSTAIPKEILQDSNLLEIEVANLMANRIIWLENQDVEWKEFYNINFPARFSENSNRIGLFDASDWEPFPSGLLGPVVLYPAQSN